MARRYWCHHAVIGNDDGTISFDEFGRSFVREIVTPERVAAAIAAVVGDEVKVGPLAAGPADAARATLRGKLAGVDVKALSAGDNALHFRAMVSLDCSLAVKAPAINKRYRGTLTIPLRLEVRTASPVRLVINVEVPSPQDIGVELEAKDRSGRLIQLLGNIDGEVRERTAVEVARRVEAPEARRHRQIDILAMVDDVWQP
jgi:hypothetical protein